MTYFDDIQFVSAEEVQCCRAVVDRRFAGTWSVEFMRSGSIAMGMNGGPQETVEDPILFWHSPEHSYQYGAVDENGWHHHWVMTRGRRAKRLVEEGFAPLSGRGFLRVRQAEALESLFHRLIDLVELRDPRGQPERVILLDQILSIAISDARDPVSVYHRRAEIDAIAEAVSRDPLVQHDFKQIAREIGLSYHRFRHVFREQIGQAPHELVMSCRMRKASELLLDSRLQVQQVAGLCGYDDPAVFCRTFKKKVGLSPRQYRYTHFGFRP